MRCKVVISTYSDEDEIDIPDDAIALSTSPQSDGSAVSVAYLLKILPVRPDKSKTENCPRCEGTTGVDNECPRCDGKGYILKK